jgi:hypothetical protein
MYRLPETIPHPNTSYWTISLGDYTYILDNGVAKGTLVGRGYILSWRQDCKVEGDEEGGGERPPNLYPIPVSPGSYNTCQRVGSYWIWL